MNNNTLQSAIRYEEELARMLDLINEEGRRAVLEYARLLPLAAHYRKNYITLGKRRKNGK
jgi:hypothetical protein